MNTSTNSITETSGQSGNTNIKQYKIMRIPQEPNRPTCPDINRIQKNLNDIIKDFESFKETDEVDDFMSSMSNACSELWSIHSELEDLRRLERVFRDGYVRGFEKSAKKLKRKKMTEKQQNKIVRKALGNIKGQLFIAVITETPHPKTAIEVEVDNVKYFVNFHFGDFVTIYLK